MRGHTIVCMYVFGTPVHGHLIQRELGLLLRREAVMDCATTFAQNPNQQIVMTQMQMRSGRGRIDHTKYPPRTYL